MRKISELHLLEQLEAYRIDPCELLTSALIPGNTGVWLSSNCEEKNDVCKLRATKSLVGITSVNTCVVQVELTIFQYLLADLHVN